MSARETLASTAQDYLDALAQSPGAPADVQLEAAQGFARLGALYSRQAVSDAANRDIASDAFAKALALLEALVDTHPNTAASARSTPIAAMTSCTWTTGPSMPGTG